ncbi:MAG: acetate--CoA ligase alpha subunit [Anaerolineae bacterium]|jgi:acetyl coenzyme A synthetase (ADP forming)-like protein
MDNTNGGTSMLEMFFEPKSIAIIGASADPEKIGYQVLRNLIGSKFPGQIYPINPRSEEILGLKVYKSVLDTPGPVDQAVILIPARAVLPVIRECGEKGVKGAVVITAGFREGGAEGAQREKELLEVAAEYGMRIIGPNCLGVIDTLTPMNASFAKGTPERGSIAFMSQSGALCAAILDQALAEGIGFSHFVSLGNKSDIDEVSLLEAWRDDENTNVIIAYIEGLRDGAEFVKEAYATAKKTPIIAVKSGRTAMGSRAVSSHTGSLAGADAAYSAGFKQAGVIRAETMEHLFDIATALAYQPLLKGNRIAILTNAGGPGVMATDALEKYGLSLATLTDETREALASKLPAAASTQNPVDVLGDARADRYMATLETVLADPNVDGVLVIVTPQSATEIVETAEAVVDVCSRATKPVFGCWMGKMEATAGIDLLAKNRVPNYLFPERAIMAFGSMWDYRRFLEEPETEVETFEVDRAAVARVFEQARKEGRTGIGDAEAQDILKAYGIRTPQSDVFPTPDGAVAFCEKIGYPVVMKIASPDILHKSDVGGIIVGVRDEAAAREAFDTLIARAKERVPNATIWGVQVQEMVTDAREVIIGMNRDPQFGPLIMFGLGGIYVEVLRDVAFRVAPMTRLQAESMVKEIRSYKLLAGVRGQKPADMDAIVDTILRIAQLVMDWPEIAELDINPLLVRPQGEGGVAVDMRLILKPA